jgi:hypothetical protein
VPLVSAAPAKAMSAAKTSTGRTAVAAASKPYGVKRPGGYHPAAYARRKWTPS